MGDIFDKINVKWNSKGKHTESATERVKRAEESQERVAKKACCKNLQRCSAASAAADCYRFLIGRKPESSPSCWYSCAYALVCADVCMCV